MTILFGPRSFVGTFGLVASFVFVAISQAHGPIHPVEPSGPQRLAWEQPEAPKNEGSSGSEQGSYQGSEEGFSEGTVPPPRWHGETFFIPGMPSGSVLLKDEEEEEETTEATQEPVPTRTRDTQNIQSSGRGAAPIGGMRLPYSQAPLELPRHWRSHRRGPKHAHHSSWTASQDLSNEQVAAGLHAAMRAYQQARDAGDLPAGIPNPNRFPRGTGTPQAKGMNRGGSPQLFRALQSAQFPRRTGTPQLKATTRRGATPLVLPGSQVPPFTGSMEMTRGRNTHREESPQVSGDPQNTRLLPGSPALHLRLDGVREEPHWRVKAAQVPRSTGTPRMTLHTQEDSQKPVHLPEGLQGTGTPRLIASSCDYPHVPQTTQTLGGVEIPWLFASDTDETPQNYQDHQVLRGTPLHRGHVRGNPSRVVHSAQPMRNPGASWARGNRGENSWRNAHAMHTLRGTGTPQLASHSREGSPTIVHGVGGPLFPQSTGTPRLGVDVKFGDSQPNSPAGMNEEDYISNLYEYDGFFPTIDGSMPRKEEEFFGPYYPYAEEVQRFVVPHAITSCTSDSPQVVYGQAFHGPASTDERFQHQKEQQHLQTSVDCLSETGHTKEESLACSWLITMGSYHNSGIWLHQASKTLETTHLWMGKENIRHALLYQAMLQDVLCGRQASRAMSTERIRANSDTQHSEEISLDPSLIAVQVAMSVLSEDDVGHVQPAQTGSSAHGFADVPAASTVAHEEDPEKMNAATSLLASSLSRSLWLEDTNFRASSSLIDSFPAISQHSEPPAAVHSCFSPQSESYNAAQFALSGEGLHEGSAASVFCSSDGHHPEDLMFNAEFAMSRGMIGSIGEWRSAETQEDVQALPWTNDPEANLSHRAHIALGKRHGPAGSRNFVSEEQKDATDAFFTRTPLINESGKSILELLGKIPEQTESSPTSVFYCGSTASPAKNLDTTLIQVHCNPMRDERHDSMNASHHSPEYSSVISRSRTESIPINEMPLGRTSSNIIA